MPWWLEPDLWMERLCEAYEGAAEAGLGGARGRRTSKPPLLEQLQRRRIGCRRWASSCLCTPREPRPASSSRTRFVQDTILDQPDRPFPGSLAPTIPGIRTLYRQAKILAWDPESAIPWAEFDRSMYSDEQLWAARVYWSGRGWSEYGAIAESPALQLRYDLDQLEPDLSLYWALRTEEEARHAEVSARFADLLGGYIPEPPNLVGDEAVSQVPADGAPSEVLASTSHLGTRARALAPDVPVEATIAGLVCVAETVAYDVFLELVKATQTPSRNGSTA